MDGELHRIHIELELDGSSPAGSAMLIGGDTRTFTGWMGLVAAVDGLVRRGDEAGPTEMRE